MTDELDDYFYHTAEAELAKARIWADQGRKARAQEALREAKYWVIKCNPENTKKLTDSIIALDYELHL